MTATKNKHIQHAEHDLYKDVDKIKEALFDFSHDIKGKAGTMISDSVENVKDRSNLIKNQVTDYTVEKPLKSLGIAMLIGAIFGFWLRKK